MVLGRALAYDDHIHKLVIIRDFAGWEVREEEDNVVVHRTHHTDWQRVEIDVRLFDMQAMALTSGNAAVPFVTERPEAARGELRTWHSVA